MSTQKNLDTIKALVDRISFSIFGQEFRLRVEQDNVFKENGRIFIQVVYDAPCTKSGENQEWHGRKWYLSEFMTPDEVVKTAYGACEMAVKHEIMEGFKVDGKILFNPHVTFEALLDVSDREVRREPKKD
jgi:hypothetical protein